MLPATTFDGEGDGGGGGGIEVDDEDGFAGLAGCCPPWFPAGGAGAGAPWQVVELSPLVGGEIWLVLPAAAMVLHAYWSIGTIVWPSGQMVSESTPLHQKCLFIRLRPSWIEAEPSFGPAMAAVASSAALRR